MKKIFNISALLAMCLMIFAGCQEDIVSTDQYTDQGVTLKAFGPSPVMRGGELRFLGTNLDQVKEVIIPGVSPITDITVVKSGNPSEIRVIVPKDGPEPGLVTLKTADGKEIVTKSQLTYSEPIVIESLTPASIAPGETLTIKGDYFNLIHEVVFAEGVLVSEKDFKKHDRYEIQVVVPVEARTGVVGLGDLDELNNEDPKLFANVIYSEEELVVAQPEVTKMEADGGVYKPGVTVVSLTGKNFQYVAEIKAAGVTVAGFTTSAANDNIIFLLPATSSDGEVVLVAKSGVEVVAGTYETVVPTELAAAPQPVKAGATLTITGKDLDLVTGINFPGKEGVDFQTAESITLTVPDTAQEGDVALNMANGKSVTVAYTLVKPVVTALPASASAGSEMTITGTDLDLVKSVTFGGDIVVEVEAKETEITVAVPTTAETAALKLNLANGTSVETEPVTIDKPVACYITELPGPDQEINGGQVLIVPVANEDKLTGVQVNGEDVKFLLNNTDLYITIPRLAKAGTVLKLISSNGAVEYVIDCIPATISRTVIWTGEFNAGHWGGNQDLAWGGYDWSSIDLSVGALTLEFEVTTNDWGENYWQFELRKGADWSQLTDPIHVDLTSDQKLIEIPLTESLLNDLINNQGLVITGKEFTLTKITLKTEISLNTTLWEGSVKLAWSDPGKVYLAASDFATVKAGTKIRFTYSFPKSTWAQMQINNGKWATIAFPECPSGVIIPSDIHGWDDNVDRVLSDELTLTQEILDNIQANKGDNGELGITGFGIVIQGDGGMVLTKIELVP